MITIDLWKLVVLLIVFAFAFFSIGTIIGRRSALNTFTKMFQIYMDGFLKGCDASDNDIKVAEKDKNA